MHVGGRPEPTTLTDREKEICAAIGPELKKRGMIFVGIDVIGGYLTEINVPLADRPAGDRALRRRASGEGDLGLDRGEAVAAAGAPPMPGTAFAPLRAGPAMRALLILLLLALPACSARRSATDAMPDAPLARAALEEWVAWGRVVVEGWPDLRPRRHRRHRGALSTACSTTGAWCRGGRAWCGAICACGTACWRPMRGRRSPPTA